MTYTLFGGCSPHMLPFQHLTLDSSLYNIQNTIIINFRFLSALFFICPIHFFIGPVRAQLSDPLRTKSSEQPKTIIKKEIPISSYSPFLSSFLPSPCPVFLSCDALILFLSCFPSFPLSSVWGCVCVCMCVCFIFCSTAWACVGARVSGASISNFKSYHPLIVYLKEVFTSLLFPFLVLLSSSFMNTAILISLAFFLILSFVYGFLCLRVIVLPILSPVFSFNSHPICFPLIPVFFQYFLFFMAIFTTSLLAHPSILLPR